MKPTGSTADVPVNATRPDTAIYGTEGRNLKGVVLRNPVSKLRPDIANAYRMPMLESSKCRGLESRFVPQKPFPQFLSGLNI
jgi:hypothetical protein